MQADQAQELVCTVRIWCALLTKPCTNVPFWETTFGYDNSSHKPMNMNLHETGGQRVFLSKFARRDAVPEFGAYRHPFRVLSE